MARTARDTDYVSRALYQVGALIRAGDPKGAESLTRDALRAIQDRNYDHAVHADNESERGEDRPGRRTGGAPAPRKAGQFRRRLFDVARPKVILGPVNVVEVYLSEHPMWATWGWDDTRGVNARMLPFLQGLDPGDRLPDDARLALPITAAGFFLVRALHLSPDMPRVALTADVYRIITEAIVTVDRFRAPEGLAEDFAHVTDTAHMLLLRAVALGLDAWDHRLILRCTLGAKCQREEPFYVNAPAATAGHVACRVAAHRLVTRKGRRKKK
jgi:hypothetical protein